MSLLGKLKSLFGKESPDTDEPRDTSVTVEREPGDTTTEAGTESAESASGTASPESPGSSDEETTSEPTDDGVDEPETDPVIEEPQTDPVAEADEHEAEESDADEQESDTDEQPTGTPVDKIKGVGPTYADRLGEAGIDTIEQLADADPVALADETDIAESRVENWVEQAKARSK